MADSAVDVRGNKLTKPPKPLQPADPSSPTGKPRNQRFIGLLIAYVLITLLVVYMVVCAVCFQPRNCKPCLVCHKPPTDSLQTPPPLTAGRAVYCVAAEAPSTPRPDLSRPPPRLQSRGTGGHFSRSIGSGERFLQETASLELLAPHALAARGGGHPSPVGAWHLRSDHLRPGAHATGTGTGAPHRDHLTCFEAATPSVASSASSSKLVHQNRHTPVVFTKVAC